MESEDDIVLLQETKSWQAAVDKLRRPAKQAGFCLHAENALGATRTNFSGGVMVAWRRHLCVSNISAVQPSERYIDVTLRSALLGEIVIGSIYVHQGSSLEQGGEADLLLMHVFGNHRDCGARILIGGDFNHPPLEMAAWLEANAMPFLVVAQSDPTFVSRAGQSNIDFFVASKEIAMAMSCPTILTGSGLAGHSPVRSGWQRAIFHQKVAVWRRPPAPNNKAVTGPLWSSESNDLLLDNIKLDVTYNPSRGAMRTISFSQHDHDQALEALQQWTKAVVPTLQANYGIEDIKHEQVTSVTTTLKQALKYGEKDKTLPRFLFVMARHLAAVANSISNKINTPVISNKQICSLTKGIKNQANTWLAAVNDILKNLIPKVGAQEAVRTTSIALEKVARQEMKQAQMRDLTDWKETMKQLMQNADSKAFAYVKGSALVRPEGDLIHFRDSSRQKWKQIWNGQDASTNFQEVALLEGMIANNRPPLTVQELRQASKSFSTKTATADWWHPRLFEGLNDKQLSKLADIMFVWETIGRPAVPNQSLITKMIPKPAGGFRPIGLFPSLVRLWGKARQPYIKAWAKKEISDGTINMSPGRRVGDGTWRHKVLARLDANKGDTVLEGLWDVQKCFEQINGKKLVRIAEALGYPLELLAVSLSTYRWPRRILLDFNIIAEDVWPKSGIVAGSAHATYELAAYTVLALRILTTSWPTSRISLHVDDLSFQISHHNAQVAHHHFTHMAHEARALFAALELPFAPDKAYVISTSMSAAREASRALGLMGGSPVKQTRSLGNDLTLMSIRATKVQQERIKNLDGKARKLFFVSDSTHPVRQVFNSSLKSGAIYGCEITEINGSAMQKLRAGGLRAAGVHLQGAPHDILWAAIGVAGDPQADIRWAPLERYHREWWMTTSSQPPEDVLSPPQLVAAFEMVDKDRFKCEDARARQADTVAMALHGAWIVGWTFQNATMVDINGITLSLLMVSPAGLKRIYMEHYQRAIDAKATETLLNKIQAATDLPHPHETPLMPWNMVRSLATGFTRKKNRKALTQLLRDVSCSVVTGKYMSTITGKDTPCPKCDHDNDDTQHRLFDCPAISHERKEHFLPSLGRHSPRDTAEYATKYCGLIPIPRKLLPPEDYTTISSPAWPRMEEIDIAEVFKEDYGAAYTDASAYFASDLYFSRVAIAMVQVDPRGKILAAWGTTLPQQLATHPGVGEHLAAFIYAKNFPNSHIVSDCQGVISNIGNHKHASHARNPMAGAWRQISSTDWPTCSKVKAHRSHKKAQEQGDITEWHGNRLADQWAKHAAISGMPFGWQNDVTHYIKNSKDLLAAHIELHIQWPSPPQFWWKDKAATPDTQGGQAMQGEVSVTPSHAFAPLPNHLFKICGRCFTLRDCSHHEGGTCNSVNYHNSHNLALGIVEQLHHSFIICRMCGKWAVAGSTQRWLKEKCAAAGHASVVARRKPAALRRAMAGLHPTVANKLFVIAFIGLLSALPKVAALHEKLHLQPEPASPHNLMEVRAHGAKIIFFIYLMFVVSRLIVLLAAHLSLVRLRRVLIMPVKGTAAAYARNRQRAWNKVHHGKYSNDGSHSWRWNQRSSWSWHQWDQRSNSHTSWSWSGSSCDQHQQQEHQEQEVTHKHSENVQEGIPQELSTSQGEDGPVTLEALLAGSDDVPQSQGGAETYINEVQEDNHPHHGQKLMEEVFGQYFPEPDIKPPLPPGPPPKPQPKKRPPATPIRLATSDSAASSKAMAFAPWNQPQTASVPSKKKRLLNVLSKTIAELVDIIE